MNKVLTISVILITLFFSLVYVIASIYWSPVQSVKRFATNGNSTEDERVFWLMVEGWDDAILNDVIPLLNDDNEEVRSTVVNIVNKRNMVERVDAVREMAEHDASKRVRLVSIQCMGRIGGEMGSKWLLNKLIGTEDKDMVIVLLRSLGDTKYRMESIEYINVVVDKLSDEEVIVEAAGAMSSLCDIKSRNDLIELESHVSVDEINGYRLIAAWLFFEDTNFSRTVLEEMIERRNLNEDSFVKSMR